MFSNVGYFFVKPKANEKSTLFASRVFKNLSDALINIGFLQLATETIHRGFLIQISAD